MLYRKLFPGLKWGTPPTPRTPALSRATGSGAPSLPWSDSDLSPAMLICSRQGSQEGEPSAPRARRLVGVPVPRILFSRKVAGGTPQLSRAGPL